jgi:hypothetical protein
MTDHKGNPIGVGDFAHNIESARLGRVVEIKEMDGLDLATMHGVDTLAWYVGGLSLLDSVDERDIQWHHVKDLALLLRASASGGVNF